MSDKKWEKKYEQNKLLIFGILLITISIYFGIDSFAIKSRLTPITGTLKNAKTYIETVSDWRGNKSNKSELIFYLKEYKKKFYLSQNIGKNYIDKEYENILKDLTKVDSISIWVRPREIDDYEPKIFQITSGNKIILEFDDIRIEKSPVAIFTLIIGIGFILLFFRKRFPDQWYEIFNKSKK